MIDLKKNILIVCEGEGAEPSYFNYYRDLLIDKEVDVNIKISPKSKEENIESQSPNKRKGFKSRFIKDVEKEPIGDLIEEEYRAQPVCYVREAQMGIESQAYDEVWAVYDKDGHAEHEKAYELSLKKIDDKIVNLGFSSVAFEFWILLHFQDSKIAFEKALCRDGRPYRQYRYCGTDSHEDDCKGEKCVCGNITSQVYLKYHGGKKLFLIDKYAPYVKDAIYRSIQLRKSLIGNGIIFYDENPYTSLDRLVFKLLNLDRIDFQFFDLSVEQNIGAISISTSLDNNDLEIVITLLVSQTYILNQDQIVLVNIHGDLINIIDRQVLSLETKEFRLSLNLESLVNFNPLYFGYKIANKAYKIAEL